MPAQGTQTGHPTHLPKPKKRRRVKPRPVHYATPNAITGGKGVAKVHRQVKAIHKSKVHQAARAQAKAAARTLGEQRRLNKPKPIRTPTAQFKKLQRQTKHAYEPKGESLGSSLSSLGKDLRRGESLLARTVGAAPELTLTKHAPTGPSKPSLKKQAEAAAIVAAPEAAGAALRGVARLARATKAGERLAKAGRVVEEAPKEKPSVPERAKAKVRKVKPKEVKANLGRKLDKSSKAKIVRPAGKRPQRYAAGAAAVTPSHKQDSSNPAQIGKAFVQGQLAAIEHNPKKTLATTGRAVPASLAYALGTVPASAARSVINQDSAPLANALREGGRAFTSLKPLASGDPKKVQKATEESVGLIELPLLPKGLISRPAKLAGGKIAKGAKAIEAKLPKGPVPDKARPPGPLRRTAQVIAGGKTRKRVATLYSRAMHPEHYAAERAHTRIEHALRKAPHTRSLRNRHGTEAGDLVPILHRYGISRKEPLKQLRHVRSTLEPGAKVEGTDLTTAEAIDWAEHHPGVLKDEATWKAVDHLKEAVRPITTSKVAQHRAQARVLSHGNAGILVPEERIPPHVHELTGARTRTNAYKDIALRERTIKGLRDGARRNIAKAAEVRKTNRPRWRELRSMASAQRQKAKTMEVAVNELKRELRPFTKPGQSLSGKRLAWTPQMAKDFVAETKAAAKAAGYEEPGWLSEKTPPEVMAGQNYPKTPGKVWTSQGINERRDLADRSLRSVLENSIYRPHLQRGTQRFIRQFTAEFAKTKQLRENAAQVFTGKELGTLRKEGQFDPRSEVALPSRSYAQALEGQKYDEAVPPDIVDNLNKRLKGELDAARDKAGTKYIVVDREAATELLDQLAPKGGHIEQALSPITKAASGIILYSPAWALSQIVAEGGQALVASGPWSYAHYAAELARLKKRDPKGWEDLNAIAGATPGGYLQPGSTRVTMEGTMMHSFADASRAIRKNPATRALASVPSLFRMFDRWKGGKNRTILLAMKADQTMSGKHGFLTGMSGMLQSVDHLSNAMKDMSTQERLSWMARHPRQIDKHLDYLDDVLGNWQAYTRYEKEFAPLVLFYPYLRMSLRWTFWSMPKRHPVRSTILYALAQQNSNELKKLLGDPNFLEYSMPVVWGSDKSKPDLVLPGGSRFGAPGSNVLIQSIGEDNIAGLGRLAAPPFSTLGYAATGINPMTGLQDKDINKGLLALNQLLSMSPAVRALGLNRQGIPPNDITKAFANIDPHKVRRSILDPFEPLTTNRAQMQHSLGKTLDESSVIQGELGQFIKLADRVGIKEATKQLRKDIAAGEKLKSLSGSTDSKIKKIEKAFYETKYPTKKKSSSSSSSSGFSGGGFGSGLSGGGL